LVERKDVNKAITVSRFAFWTLVFVNSLENVLCSLHLAFLPRRSIPAKILRIGFLALSSVSRDRVIR
jgi:hypothetical protein